VEGEVTASFRMGRRVYYWMYVGISIKNYSLYQPISWLYQMRGCLKSGKKLLLEIVRSNDR
jgi:uncharacterized SAM-dependent methyltransferase